MVVMALWFLKSKYFSYRLCPMFGIVESSLSALLSYSIHMMYIAVSEYIQGCSIKWPSEVGIKGSANLLARNRLNGHFCQVYLRS